MTIARRFILLIGACASVPSQAQPAPTQFEIAPIDVALTRFNQFCMVPLPDAQAFTTSMNTSGLRWQNLNRTAAEAWGIGNAWQSVIGIITYRQRRPQDRMLIGNPACHFDFAVHDTYTHAVAAAVVQQSLSLGEPCHRRGERDQTRWERMDARGFEIRVFLTSEEHELGQRGARLSVSRLIPRSSDVAEAMRDVDRCH